MLDEDDRLCRTLPSIFRLAKNVSKLSLHRHHVGSVIVVNGHPVSVGCNQRKTHPDAPYSGLHAEVQAIKTSGKSRLEGSTIVVYREKKDGTVGLARPCKNCMVELRKNGIKRVFYTIDEFPYWKVEKI